ncbi:MAG: dienelactone hydrolase family protein [Pseudomonadota bacterium]|jgi:carboxymethylenebutenolidase|nr:dienelactone hydrolase family protein [Pseudomonadota bacterium]
MGTSIELTTSDGHTLGAYKATPDGNPKGGVVVIQEIFGVNQHIRNVTDEFAKNGFVAVAPALFDRTEKGLELGYGQDDFQKGKETRGSLNDEGIQNDVQAAIDEAAKAGKVGIVGYCFGGYVSWLAACKCNGLSAASTFYGGGIHAKREDTPKVPVILNFGDNDGGIPLSQVHDIKEANPEIPCYVYDEAGHGFCCDDRESYNQGACERAHKRTLDHFASHVG